MVLMYLEGSPDGVLEAAGALQNGSPDGTLSSEGTTGGVPRTLWTQEVSGGGPLEVLDPT